MVRAYFDESKEGNIFLVAGWVASQETWHIFSYDWRKVLKEAPAIAYFKHHDAKTLPPSGAFSGLSTKQAEEKLSRLVDVICKHQMYGVATGLKTTIHDAAFRSDVLSRKRLKQILKLTHYYQSGVFSATAMVFQLQLEAGDKTSVVDFVFDHMGSLLSDCIEQYDLMKEQLPEEKKAIAGKIIEGDDKIAEGLQAADLLSGQMIIKFRLGSTEAYFRKMATCHTIHFHTAYLPQFKKIGELVSAVNDLSVGLRATKKMEQILKTIRPEDQ